MAIRSHLFQEQNQRIDVKAVAPEVPDDLAAIVASFIDPDPAARPRTAAMAFSLLWDWFTQHAPEHGVRLKCAPEVSFDPYLAASAFCGCAKELAAAELFFEGLRSQEVLPSRSAPEGRRLTLEERRQRLAPSILRICGESGSGKSRLSKQIGRSIRGEYHLIHILSDRELGAYPRVLELCEEFEASYKEKMGAAQAEGAELCRRFHDPDDALYVPDIKDGVDPRYAALRAGEITEKERAQLGELFDQYRLERFAAMLRLLSYEKPVCFLVEDAQWLDRASMRLIGAAMRFVAGSRVEGFRPRVAFIVNHRLKEVGDQLDYVLEQIASVANLEQPAIVLELSPFSAADAEALVVSMLGLADAKQQEEARGFVKELAARRVLTPLSVEQSLWSLFGDGRLVKRSSSGRWNGEWNLAPALISEASVPASVREAIGQRAARLNTQTLRVLGVAAVAGKVFDIELVARAGELEGKEVIAAADLAGRAGFVRRIDGNSSEYLSDLTTNAVTYGFLHDRYREAIVDALPPEVQKRLHSAIARAIKVRYGENETTWERLAEHHDGAAEYAQAYPYAEQIADYAFERMENEQAARNYQLAARCRSRIGEHASARLLDRCAQSMESLGRYADAQVHLRELLGHPELTTAARMDVNRRLASSAHRQQDYKNALPPLLELLKSHGIALPPRRIHDYFLQAQGLFYLLAAPFIPALIRRTSADDPAVETQIMNALLIAAECAAFVDFRLGVANCLAICQRAIRTGVNLNTPIAFGFMAYVTGMTGLHAHSKRSDAQAALCTPAYASAQPDRAFSRMLAQRNMLLISNKFYRGELGRAYDADLAQLFSSGLASLRSCGDLQCRWIWLAASAQLGAFSGRLQLFGSLMNSLLALTAQSNLGYLCSLYGPFMVAVVAEVEGRDAHACTDGEVALSAARKQGDMMSALNITGLCLLCQARSSIRSPDLTSRALEAVRDWMQWRISNPCIVGLGCLVAAAALFEYRAGLRKPSNELREMLTLAKPNCLRERQLTPYFLAAEATVAAMQGAPRRAIMILKRATDHAVQWGFLGSQLTAVLRIAKWILPSGTNALAYFSEWERNLTAGLVNQSPIDLKDVEQGRLPPAPADGRPSWHLSA